MFSFLLLNFKKGVKKIADNPQLIYTIFVAVLITGSFIFMSERFIGIANSAEERLINVRIGSLQDAFVSFAGDKINDGEYLNKKIQNIINTNETIKNFKVIVKKINISGSELNSNEYTIIASNNINEISKVEAQDSFLYTLASSDPKNSVTIPIDNNGERLFKTARAIVDKDNNILGIVTTTQTLSLADLAIQDSINNLSLIHI